jgi:lipoyl-dependent peroxiredoxin
MIRTATAEWQGGLKDGKGTLSGPSGALKNTPYSFHDRFEDGNGTNPEELIAAAHAGCYSMALSGKLGEAGVASPDIRTEARVTMDRTDAGPTVTAIHLVTTIRAPGGDRAKIEQAAQNAKETCPISRLLAPGTRITLETKAEV